MKSNKEGYASEKMSDKVDDIVRQNREFLNKLLAQNKELNKELIEKIEKQQKKEDKNEGK